MYNQSVSLRKRTWSSESNAKAEIKRLDLQKFFGVFFLSSDSALDGKLYGSQKVFYRLACVQRFILIHGPTENFSSYTGTLCLVAQYRVLLADLPVTFNP